MPQIAQRSPGQLILFEIAESPLFSLEMEIAAQLSTWTLSHDRDIRTRPVDECPRPSSAINLPRCAYKQCDDGDPPRGGGEDERSGTRIVAEAAAGTAIERFVSSRRIRRCARQRDGATKRLAELVIHNMNGEGNRRCSLRCGSATSWAAWEA